MRRDVPPPLPKSVPIRKGDRVDVRWELVSPLARQAIAFHVGTRCALVKDVIMAQVAVDFGDGKPYWFKLEQLELIPFCSE